MGRPRLEGPRTASGRLLQSIASAPAPQHEIVLNFVQATAAETWSRNFQNAQRLDHAGKRMTALDNRRAAERALAKADVVILDMVAGKGLSLAVLAEKTGRTVPDLAEMYRAALTRLAAHYEALRAKMQEAARDD